MRIEPVSARGSKRVALNECFIYPPSKTNLYVQGAIVSPSNYAISLLGDSVTDLYGEAQDKSELLTRLSGFFTLRLVQHRRRIIFVSGFLSCYPLVRQEVTYRTDQRTNEMKLSLDGALLRLGEESRELRLASPPACNLAHPKSLIYCAR